MHFEPACTYVCVHVCVCVAVIVSDLLFFQLKRKLKIAEADTETAEDKIEELTA